jgi:hypothetical protein
LHDPAAQRYKAVLDKLATKGLTPLLDKVRNVKIQDLTPALVLLLKLTSDVKVRFASEK